MFNGLVLNYKPFKFDFGFRLGIFLSFLFISLFLLLDEILDRLPDLLLFFFPILQFLLQFLFCFSVRFELFAHSCKLLSLCLDLFLQLLVFSFFLFNLILHLFQLLLQLFRVRISFTLTQRLSIRLQLVETWKSLFILFLQLGNLLF